eukprot:3467236-Pleurochrysis_carterae.AAC.1
MQPLPGEAPRAAQEGAHLRPPARRCVQRCCGRVAVADGHDCRRRLAACRPHRSCHRSHAKQLGRRHGRRRSSHPAPDASRAAARCVAVRALRARASRTSSGQSSDTSHTVVGSPARNA